MKNLNYSFTLLFMLLCNVISYSQTELEGIIITKKGDILAGKIISNWRNWERTPKFIVFKNSDVRKRFRPTELQSFTIHPKNSPSRKFQSLPVTITESNLKKYNVLVFVERLVKGKADLYVYKDPHFWNHYFVAENNSRLIEIIYQGYLKVRPVHWKKGVMLLPSEDGTDIPNKLSFAEQDFINGESNIKKEGKRGKPSSRVGLKKQRNIHDLRYFNLDLMGVIKDTTGIINYDYETLKNEAQATKSVTIKNYLIRAVKKYNQCKKKNKKPCQLFYKKRPKLELILGGVHHYIKTNEYELNGSYAIVGFNTPLILFPNTFALRGELLVAYHEPGCNFIQYGLSAELDLNKSFYANFGVSYMVDNNQTFKPYIGFGVKLNDFSKLNFRYYNWRDSKENYVRKYRCHYNTESYNPVNHHLQLAFQFRLTPKPITSHNIFFFY